MSHEAERIEVYEIVLTEGTAEDVCRYVSREELLRRGPAYGCRRMSDTDLTEDNVRAVTRLGAPFKVMDTRPNRSRSRSPHGSLPLPDRATCMLPIGGISGRW